MVLKKSALLAEMMEARGGAEAQAGTA
jgi:hypothetical protein